MAILNKLSDRTVIVISVVILVLAAVVLGVFQFNTGVDYMDATVFVAQLDHEEKLATVIANADMVQSPSRVEKESTGKFYLYYQNLDQDQLNKIKDGFQKVQTGVLSFDRYYYTPAREYFLKDRIILISICVAVIAFIYLLYIFRGLKLKRDQVLALIVSEKLLLLFGVVVNLGFASLLGKSGVVMDTPFFSFTLGAFAVLCLFSIYSLIRIRDLLILEKFTDLTALFARMKNKYWPEAVFVFSAGLLTVALPWVVVERSVAFGALQLLWSLLTAMFIFFYLRPALCRNLIKLTANLKLFSKSHFWQKQW